MMDLVPAGARVTLLDRGWAALPVAETYIGETLNLTARAAGRISEVLQVEYEANYLRPLAPVHIKINYIATDVIISWIRQSRLGGESWAGLDIPLGEESEMYRVQFLFNNQVVSEYETVQVQLTRPESELSGINQISITQGSRSFGWGASAIIEL